MKRWFRFVLGTLLVVCLPLLDVLYAVAAEIQFLYPSQPESVIAPGREFYVIGSIDITPHSEEFTLSADLYRVGERTPVQSVYAINMDYREGINVNYIDNVIARSYDCKSGDIYGSGMPDLVYEPTIQGSFQDARRKCYYDKDYFSTLFSSKGLPLGKYEVVVTLQAGGGKKTGKKEITIDNVPAKICARFSPSEHFNFVKTFATREKYRVYTDPFAGYWSSSGGSYWKRVLSLGTNKTIEIPLKLSECEAAEYSAGMLHTVLYNINETCATNSLEIGQLQYMQHIDRMDRIAFYYYNYNPDDSCIEPLASPNLELKKLPHGDQLEPVRLDAVVDKAVHNSLDLNMPIKPIAPISAKSWDLRGKNYRRYVALYGVVTPIQNGAREITKNSIDGKFSVLRRIESVSYDISIPNQAQGGIRVISADVIISTDLVRRFPNGRTDTSIYEYRHVFDLSGFKERQPEWLRFDIIGRDSEGNFVEGSKDHLELLM